MTTRSTGPVPCGHCDAWLATVPADRRDYLEGVRCWLDDRETGAARPHKHIADVTGADHDDYWRAIEREHVEETAIYALGVRLRSLIKTGFFANDDETWTEAEARAVRQGDVVRAAAAHALVAEIADRQAARTYYLGGGPTIVREADGEFSFVTGRAGDEEEAQ